MPTMHEVDYEILGDDMQFVKIELDPGEAVVAEAGSMMYIEDGIQMDTVFGDGAQQNQGFMGALLGAGKRLLTGESLFMTVFHNESQQKRKVAFAAPYPGKIQPLHLAELGGELMCQKDSFLCAAKGVSLGIAFTKRFGAGLFGGEGFHPAASPGGWLDLRERGRHARGEKPRAGRDVARRHRLPGRVSAQRHLRHPVRRRSEDGVVRRRGSLLRRAARTGTAVAPVAAVQPLGGPDLRRRPPGRGQAPRGGVDSGGAWERS